MHVELCDPEVARLVQVYLAKLDLPEDSLYLTTNRKVFERWIGRKVAWRIGGAYSMHPRTGEHRVFVHLDRLDPANPNAAEIVVVEELIHMRDHLHGDFRRHSHHGYDRIAHEVHRVAGFSPEEQRAIFRERAPRPFARIYVCPACGLCIARRRRGTWSCGRCAPRFMRSRVLREVPRDGWTLDMHALIDRLNRPESECQDLVHSTTDD